MEVQLVRLSSSEGRLLRIRLRHDRLGCSRASHFESVPLVLQAHQKALYQGVIACVLGVVGDIHECGNEDVGS